MAAKKKGRGKKVHRSKGRCWTKSYRKCKTGKGKKGRKGGCKYGRTKAGKCRKRRRRSRK